MIEQLKEIDFKTRILNQLNEKKQTIYVLKGFQDLSFEDLGMEKLYTLNFDEIIEKDQIDMQLLTAELMPKLISQKSYILSYEEFLACIDMIEKLFEIYNYKIKIIVNNLFHHYYPAASFFDEKLLQKKIIENKDLIINKIFNEFVLINNDMYVEYPGFDEYGEIENIQIFDTEDLNLSVEDDENCIRFSFGSTEETYLRFLYSVFSYGHKQINISVDAVDLMNYQKNLLSILHTLGYEIRLVRRAICTIEDHRIPQYLDILKRKNKDYEFRNIKFYRNPGFLLETREVSQSEIISALTINALHASENEDYNDIFVTAPTGSGKSVLFQIPAIYLAENYDLLTIIVTPLIGLMNDQVENIQQMTKLAATINSEYTPEEKEKIKQQIIQKEISILYVSPETLLANNPISNLIGDRKIGLLIVDESHIVSTWGKSFRPDYWFLGDYISYLRNKQNYQFPIATFSATITYGGNDDMHGDIIDSLKMKTGEYEYIAPMRRDDIHFDIQIKEKENDYLKEKETVVMNSLHQLMKEDKKTIVYFPYTSQVNEYYKRLASPYTARYHGSLPKIEKDASAENFKTGKVKLMLATKAFGMGIDIDDIQVVYHYAPTGNLCDYIQEIGRAARRPKIQGTAKIDFFANDYRYIKQLFGMSSIKNYQLTETLKKIKEIYLVKKKRNFTISPDEFSYIFPYAKDMQDVDNQLKTALLMIQKDFERNPAINFKPIIFKPRSIFTKGYFMIKEEDLKKLKKTNYFKYFRLFSTADQMATSYENEYINTYLDNKTLEVKQFVNKTDVKVSYQGDIYTVDFKKLWEENFNDLSFSQFKYRFYKGELENFQISENFLPEYLLTITSKKGSFEDAINQLELIMNDLITEFSRPEIDRTQIKIEDIGKMFEKNENLDLSYYESLVASENFIEFINNYQTASSFNTNRVFKLNQATNRYAITSINSLKNKINRLIYDAKAKFASVLQAKNKVFLLNLKNGKKVENSKEIIMAQIFEMFRLATYQVVSGERPEYFIRINSISQIEKILDNENYESEMIKLVRTRHEQSIKIMNQFFMELSEDKERWDYIENYFAGFLEEVCE